MNTGVDRALLHGYLWSKTDRMNRIRLDQKALAAQLGVNHYTMSRIVHELLDAGRIRRLSIGHGNARTYIVADPEAFDREESHV